MIWTNAEENVDWGLSKEDRKVINSRVIGYNGLQLPPIFEGKHTENICNQPIQKNSTTII